MNRSLFFAISFFATLAYGSDNLDPRCIPYEITGVNPRSTFFEERGILSAANFFAKRTRIQPDGSYRWHGFHDIEDVTFKPRSRLLIEVRLKKVCEFFEISEEGSMESRFAIDTRDLHIAIPPIKD